MLAGQGAGLNFGGAGKFCYFAKFVRGFFRQGSRSSMDRTRVSGTRDAGPIPAGSTNDF